MIRVLWITPNLNHYKTIFLNRLAENPEQKITILAGARMLAQWHRFWGKTK